jgi:hypothetical protein
MEICLQGRHCHISKLQKKKKRARREGTIAEIDKRLKEHEQKVTADIERLLAAALNEMAPSRGLPKYKFLLLRKAVVLPHRFPKSKGQ